MSRTVVRWKPRSANSSLAAVRSRSLVPSTNSRLKQLFQQGKPSNFCRRRHAMAARESPRAVRPALFGVPPSLALLPVIESGFYPTARGRRGERGLWQLRRATARRFGLVVNAHRDDRVQPERATRAAAQYLRLLHDRYGDWPLALAAYNAGERRVDRALARDPEASFWRLAERGYLPRSSRDYVPRFFAVVRVAGEQEPTAVGSAL